MHSVKEDVGVVSVAELINQELHSWRTSDFIMEMFEKEDAEAIYRIQLSRRYVEDFIVWLYNKKGVFNVKSAYKGRGRWWEEEMWLRVQGAVLEKEFGLLFGSFEFQIKWKCLVGELVMKSCQQRWTWQSEGL